MDKTKIIASAEAVNKGEVYTTKLFTGEFEHVADEPEAYLGEALKLPTQFEEDRLKIEQTLPPIAINTINYK